MIIMKNNFKGIKKLSKNTKRRQATINWSPIINPIIIEKDILPRNKPDDLKFFNIRNDSPFNAKTLSNECKNISSIEKLDQKDMETNTDFDLPPLLDLSSSKYVSKTPKFINLSFVNIKPTLFLPELSPNPSRKICKSMTKNFRSSMRYSPLPEKSSLRKGSFLVKKALKADTFNFH
ncbi:hypothetical protein SteCoe_14660 [Stentor coeruleus]|uniref:Uncharacterized protein n=1 Tax=Stentor coeruleus TaxID=5963 RepID=A0A1R2C5I3_9CILI|nr:hypothetical protein SteCoe_14660 [Stentor coeruleus]